MSPPKTHRITKSVEVMTDEEKAEAIRALDETIKSKGSPKTVTDAQINEFFKWVFRGNRTTNDSPSAPSMPTPKIPHIVTRDGVWICSKPFESKSGKKKTRCVWRMKEQPADLKAVANADAMKLDSKVVDGLGHLANDSIVEWIRSNGPDVPAGKALRAVWKAETIKGSNISLARLAQLVGVSSRPLAIHARYRSAGSSGKGILGKRKREDAEGALEYSKYTNRTGPVLTKASCTC